MRPKSRFWLIFSIGLISGSISSLAIKAAYQTESVGSDGISRFFDKPWLMSLVMFAAMSVAFPLYLWLQRPQHLKGEEDGEHRKLTLRTLVLLGIPSAADLIGSSVQQIGLVIIPVSSYQMLKGSILLFSAAFSVGFLNKKMYVHNKVGVALCVAALTIVGSASVLSREDQIKVTSFYECMLGMCFVVLGQVVCAAQYVLEEFLLKPPHDVPTLALVGVEGFWGLALMLGLVLPVLGTLPGSDVGGVMENTFDSLTKIRNSSDLQYTLILYFGTCLIFNICGVMVTHQASAVHHTFLDASRTGFIWLGSLYLFYFSQERELGEPLTSFSWIQALGFAILLMGQLVYDNLLRVPHWLGWTEEPVNPELCSVVILDSMTSPRHVVVPGKYHRTATAGFDEQLTRSLLLD
jgi:hypothetical protein